MEVQFKIAQAKKELVQPRTAGIGPGIDLYLLQATKNLRKSARSAGYFLQNILPQSAQMGADVMLG